MGVRVHLRSGTGKIGRVCAIHTELTRLFSIPNQQMGEPFLTNATYQAEFGPLHEFAQGREEAVADDMAAKKWGLGGESC